MNIPRTISTQHPDNARMPLFASGDIIGSEDEILETYLAFSRFECQEQMWDFEGKRALPWVVSELLAKNQDFFRERSLGKKVFLTFRIPNPEVEKIEAKLVPEVLDGIPRAHDVAQAFYSKNIPPVFEVILPMTTSVHQLNRIYYYYQNFVVRKKDLAIFPEDTISISQWLGEFKPERINVIPLFEDWTSLLNADRIAASYLKDKELEYQRVFLARSDPALNYGALAAVLLLNIALQRLGKLEKQIGIPIYPILGVGSPPFRGNFKPTNVESMLKGYPSSQTLTIQSAFRYDWPENIVTEAIRKINLAVRGESFYFDDKESICLAEKTKVAYQEQIPEVTSLVNRLTPFVPSRRLRKLHIGLFGYSRNVSGVRLPRAIPFCASLYSIGLPPEVLGLYCLSRKELKMVKEVYPSPNFEEDLKDALAFYNPKVLSLLSPKMRKQVGKALKVVDFETNREHEALTSQIIERFQKSQTDHLSELIVEAGQIRKFLG